MTLTFELIINIYDFEVDNFLVQEFIRKRQHKFMFGFKTPKMEICYWNRKISLKHAGVWIENLCFSDFNITKSLFLVFIYRTCNQIKYLKLYKSANYVRWLRRLRGRTKFPSLKSYEELIFNIMLKLYLPIRTIECYVYIIYESQERTLTKSTGHRCRGTISSMDTTASNYGGPAWTGTNAVLIARATTMT